MIGSESVEVEPPSRWHREGRACMAAFGFLTRLPVAGFIHHTVPDIARSATYFPVVGLVVGLLATTAFAIGLTIFTPSIAVILSVIASVLVTGAFHEDALADSLDGFGGGWQKDQVLSIMKDSRVGSYALIGTVLMVLLKTAALLGIHEQASLTVSAPTPGLLAMDVWPIARALIVAHVLARWSSVWLMRTHEYVRPPSEAGTRAIARPFAGSVTNGQLVSASVFGVAIAGSLLHWQAVAVVLAALVTTLTAGRYFRLRIGGITGDALGAANQLVEIVVYLALASRLAPSLPV